MTAEIPEELRLAVGESREIALPGLAGAGYRWAAFVEGAGDVVTVTWRRQPPDPSRGVGASGAELATVTAERPGRVVVHLVLARPWEAGRAPHTDHAIGVTVEEPGRASPPP
jgi:predicted secreted protein